MAENKPPRNRDLEQPRRTGETIEPITPAQGQSDRDRNAPLPDEETYEREPPSDRRRDRSRDED